MGVQIVVRAVRRLAISQLEIAVIAFAACAIIIYGLNWYKPKGVQTPITLLVYPDEAPYGLRDALRTADKRDQESLLYGWEIFFREFFGARDKRRGAPISNAFNSNTGLGDLWGILVSSVIFGGIHLAAWNFEFPTRVEQILWWSSSLYCSSIGIMVIFFLWLVYSFTEVFDVLNRGKSELSDNLWIGLLVVLCFLYLLARLYLLVGVFRTLCFLPPNAYISTWAANIPHIA
jgi:hypothetical protein